MKHLFHAEQHREESFRAHATFDASTDAALEDITTLAIEICGAPFASITLTAEKRRWSNPRNGLAGMVNEHDQSFCVHLLHGPEFLVVPDTTRDPRFADHPHVRGEPGVRFYAGFALVTPEGERLGALCVADRRRRRLSSAQKHGLRALSRQVVTQLELGRRLIAQQRSERELRDLAGRLERERERLVEAQAVAHVGSWETDLATQEVVWSAETYRIFNTTPEVFRPTHQAFLALVHPDDRSAVDAALVASVAVREPCTIEHRILLSDGTLKVVEERWQCFFDSAGRAVRAVGTCRDITSQRRLEQERRQLVHDLGERVKELRALHQTADLLRQTERPFDEIVASIVRLIPPAMLHPEVCAARVTLGETVHATPNWRESPWELRSCFATTKGIQGTLQIVYVAERPATDEGPFLPEERKLVDSIAEMLRSTIERRDAEVVVRESQLRQRLILDSVSEGIHGIDRHGCIVFENSAGAALLGWQEHELIGRHSHSLIHHHREDGTDYPVEECPIYRTLHDGIPRRIEHEVFFRRDGSSFPVEYTCSPIHDNVGAISGAVISFRDISERKQAERHLERLRGLARMASRLARIGAWQVNLADGSTFWSDEVRSLHEVDDAFVPTMEGMLDFYLPGSREQVRAGFQSCAGQGVPFDVEANMQSCQGRRLWVRIIGEALRNAEGRIIGIQGAIQDIEESKRAARELTETRALYAGLVNSIDGIVWEADASSLRFNFVSEQAERILGHPAQAWLDSPDFWPAHIHPEERESVVRRCRETTEQRQSHTLEYRMTRADGRSVWVRDIVAFVQLPDRPPVLRGIILDITANRAAAEALRLSEERFRELADNIGDIFFNYDPKHNRLLYANKAFEAIWGLSLDWIYEHPTGYLEHVHPEDRSSAELAFENQLRGAGAEIDFRIIRPDGTIRWIREHAVPVLDGLGNVDRIVGTMRDLTERKRAEEKLREQAALLDQAKDAIIVRDLEHHILYWSKGAERLYGWTSAEANGLSVGEILYREPSSFLRATAHVLAHGEWTGEIEQRRRDGTSLTVDGRWTLLRDERGAPKSVLAINTDITERKRLEQQFLRAQRMESIGTLAGGVAHDLNNILSPIIMGVDLLSHFGPSPTARPVLENIGRAARRGADLVQQVLSFARGVEGLRIEIDLRDIVREIQSIVENSFPKNIVFESSLPAALWPVTGDPTQLNQICLNLCVNARDAMPQGGTLTIAAENLEIDGQFAVMNRGASPGPHVVLAVSDTGVGMPRGIVERIFEPFFTTKEIGRGSGLGLSTVLGIVRSHHGFIHVDSEPGKGSTFRVYLPASTGKAAASRDVPRAEAPPRGNGELILVVDDEASIRDITKQTLETYGYRVITAEDGAKALVQFAKVRHEVALIFSDMMMPVMDGPTFIVALRHLDARVPIIAASGLETSGQVAKATSLGVKRFLPKPYTAETLLDALRQTLSELRVDPKS